MLTRLTRGELALLGIHLGDSLPEGGRKHLVSIASGDNSASCWTTLLGPDFRQLFGVDLHPGSLNLWGDDAIDWDNPLPISTSRGTADLCPVILEEDAIGVAFRMNTLTPRLLEVLSPVELRPRLANAQDGDCVTIRLLPGSALCPRK